MKSYFGDFRLESIELRANHSLNQRIRIIEFFKPEHSTAMRETIHIYVRPARARNINRSMSLVTTHILDFSYFQIKNLISFNRIRYFHSRFAQIDAAFNLLHAAS